MKTKFLIKKLDKRNVGHIHWKYHVISSMSTNYLQNFFELREWCWDTWGPSKELPYWLNDVKKSKTLCQNEHWCWVSNESDVRIYLRNDPEYTLFTLKWS
jgi:hypothetical protein